MRVPESERFVPPLILAKREVGFRAMPRAAIGVLRIARESWEAGSRTTRAAPSYGTLIHVRSGLLRVENGRSAFACAPGELAILPIGRRRTLTVARRIDCVIVNASGPLLDAHLGALAPDAVGVARLTASEAAWFDSLLDSAQTSHPEAMHAVAQALLGLLAVLRLRVAQPETAAAGGRLVRRALSRIDGVWSGPMGARDLALALGVHHSHLSRCFRRAGGGSLSDHLRRRRMDEALRLLFAGMACARVAQQLGYAESFTFSKSFRRHYGRPPSSWREIGAAPGPAAGPRG